MMDATKPNSSLFSVVAATVRNNYPARPDRAIACVAALVLYTSALAATPRSPAIRVDPPRVHLYPGSAQQLLVTEIGLGEIDRTTTAEYSSSNPDVAAVSSSGLVRALRGGNTIVEVRTAGLLQQVQVQVARTEDEPPIRFATDIVPILTKLGCNRGGCHGKATGQNGFKLSLLGFEPELDYRSIVKESRGRRIFPSDPDRSLLLLKATARIPHGGGRRLQAGSDDYRVVRQWISRGMAPPSGLDPVLDRIELSPRQRVLDTGAQQQLLVTAHFSDGTSRDVTRRAVYHSNEPDMAGARPAGLIETGTRSGLFAIMVRFGDKMETFHAAVPFESGSGGKATVQSRLDELEKQIGNSKFDKHMLRLWRRLGLVPSAPASDSKFIRRVTIDICGTLPTRKEVQDYLADDRPDKRAHLIDRLLTRPEYASYFALKWSDILQNRGRGYSTSKQRPGTALFAGWIRDGIAANKPYDQFVSEIITARGSQNEIPPAIWYRTVRTLPDYVESVAQAFLGVRIQCAQCHHHPFDRWSQADYYGLAAVFARVGRKGGFADAEVPTNQIIYLKDKAEVLHPRTGERIGPRALGGPDFQLSRYDDPRQSLAKWMRSPDNPYFARTMVNRMWAHFLGRGIIQPIDDARGTNPPSNRELLDALSREFIASGYDVKHLIRIICNTYAYGLKAAPLGTNQEDTQTFARFYSRRLTAEVLLDGISQVLEVPTGFSGGPGAFPAGTRAIELPDENVPSHFLDVFGRPARTSACECERIDAPALAQALELVNSEEIQRKLMDKNGYVAKLATNNRSRADNVEDIFLRVFARRPRSEELTTAVGFLESQEDRVRAYGSLLWSLLATNEFLFNH